MSGGTIQTPVDVVRGLPRGTKEETRSREITGVSSVSSENKLDQTNMETTER